MKNRINRLFDTKKKNILSIYFTAGYPGLNDTIPIIEALTASGVDMIELGMPFSDPLADGPVIQQSNQKALENGMSLNLLFAQLKDVRKKTDTPLLLMGYLNPVLQYGIENFCKKASEIGIDGIILPDLPLDEYEEKYKTLFEQYNLHLIFLITPQTSADRIKHIDSISNAFIYVVSAASTTGVRNSIDAVQQEYFSRIKNMSLRNPAIIGFGISNKKTFMEACKYASGTIIGSAFIKLLAEKGANSDAINDFILNILFV